jgi:sec-independent protein translocase protein TatC
MTEKSLQETDGTQPGATPEDELVDGGKVMSLFDHLDELRVVVVRAVFVIFGLFIVAMIFSTEIIEILKVPLVHALPSGADALHFTGPMDVFMAGIQVSFLTSLILGCPFWLYQFWRFLEPGLYPKERKYILPFIVASVFLFLTGISFCYFVMLPYALNFLITLGMEVGTPMITINDYLSLLTILMLAFGLVFETPVILVMLSLLNIIDADMLSEYRRIIIVIILVVAAVLTPPDPISQIAMAVPMYIMYEASIVIIRLIHRKPKTNALQKT